MTKSEMTITSTHPLHDIRFERLWFDAAARIGLRVQRTRDAYAATDGSGTIAIGADDTLDADDSVAQLVFHELCHALVQGEENLRVPDWGLDNTTDRDLVREYACLRLQAHLADAHALRALMTPTTVYRPYYNALPALPLEGTDEACTLAVRGLKWSRTSPWRESLDEALAGTADLVRVAGRWALSDDAHPLGVKLGPNGARCEGCAWRYQAREGTERCRQSADVDGTGHRVDSTFPSCARFEPPLDCRACAACCREGFDSVTVGMREAVVWRQPAMVVRRGPRFQLLRQGERCAALEGAAAPYRCTIYDDRAQACREVVPGDRRCLSARRRVGLSPS